MGKNSKKLLYKECTDEEWSTIIKIGNHMDMLIIELDERAARMDYEAQNLESYYFINHVDRFDHDQEYNNEKEVQEHINSLSTSSCTIYGIIKELKEAQTKDGSSELKIIDLGNDLDEEE